YNSMGYKFFAIVIPVVALILGNVFNGFAVAAALTVLEILFVTVLFKEMQEI
ncbi:MAG: hypothetical protein GYA87_02410, partial [Christensenellaceae bacterium]|nr:hypothetical protein [Christensenellaceae bacterium]